MTQVLNKECKAALEHCLTVCKQCNSCQNVAPSCNSFDSECIAHQGMCGAVCNTCTQACTLYTQCARQRNLQLLQEITMLHTPSNCIQQCADTLCTQLCEKCIQSCSCSCEQCTYCSSTDLVFQCLQYGSCIDFCKETARWYQRCLA